MTGMYAIAALALLAAGAIVAIFTLVVVAIHREDRAGSLRIPNPGPFASGVRSIVSFYSDSWADDHANRRRRA